MAENKEYITRQESMGTIQISEDVVASISSSVALETEGVGGLLNLFLMIRYGFAIAEVAQKVQNAVYSALEGMTGFPVKAVNVHVGGISFD